MTTTGKKRLSKAILGAAVTLAALGTVSPAMAQDGRWYGDRDGRGYRDHGYGYGYNSGNSRDAVRQCTFAVQRSASRYGRADVTRIRVDRSNRGYTVRGNLAVENRGYNSWDRNDWGRNDWRDGRYGYGYGMDTGSFRCRVEYGRVADIDIHGIRGL